nr:hypothetical protein CFP56_21941 [Quercus suber]
MNENIESLRGCRTPLFPRFAGQFAVSAIASLNSLQIIRRLRLRDSRCDFNNLEVAESCFRSRENSAREYEIDRVLSILSVRSYDYDCHTAADSTTMSLCPRKHGPHAVDPGIPGLAYLDESDAASFQLTDGDISWSPTQRRLEIELSRKELGTSQNLLDDVRNTISFSRAAAESRVVMPFPFSPVMVYNGSLEERLPKSSAWSTAPTGSGMPYIHNCQLHISAVASES